MRLDRAARFCLLGSVGPIRISLAVTGLVSEILAGVEAGTVQGIVAILLNVIVGTVVRMIFLFTLVGEYLDREPAARGLDRSEE